MLKTIEVLSFNKLRALVLRKCWIDNLQFIAFLDMPHLQILLLKGNDIVFVKSLVKNKFNLLTKICFHDNFLNKHECQHLSRVKVCKEEKYDKTICSDYFNKTRFGLPALELWMENKQLKKSGLNVSEQLFKLQQNLGTNYFYLSKKDDLISLDHFNEPSQLQTQFDVLKSWVKRMQQKIGDLRLDRNF